MGTKDKTKVQLVISHLEGCSGNFLGYLVADSDCDYPNVFRMDKDHNDYVLSINGKTTWHEEIESRLNDHSVVVTHNYNRTQIQQTFPTAQIIQIYPYTHIGNVLYNICHKKLDMKLENVIDNHFLNIQIWVDYIKNSEPKTSCTNFWDLRDKNKIQNLLGTELSLSQLSLFNRYWAQQLPHELDMPNYPMGIDELIEFWKIKNDFSLWNVAWTIFVYEHINNLQETDRLWSIDQTDKLDCWENVIKTIQSQYDTH